MNANVMNEFKKLLLSIDPSATKFTGIGTCNYTVWQPIAPIRLAADGADAECGWNIQVDRYTNADNDPIVDALYRAFDTADNIAFTYIRDYNADTGIHRHIFDCDVV